MCLPTPGGLFLFWSVNLIILKFKVNMRSLTQSAILCINWDLMMEFDIELSQPDYFCQMFNDHISPTAYTAASFII